MVYTSLQPPIGTFSYIRGRDIFVELELLRFW